MARARSRRHGEGSVTSYATKAGKRYRYQLLVLIDANEPELGSKLSGAAGFKDEDEAHEALRTAKSLRDAGVKQGGKKPTIEAYAKTWIDSLSRDEYEASTLVLYERHLRVHVVPYIGSLQVDKLTPTRIAKHYNDLRDHGRRDRHHKGEPLGVSTVNKVHITLGAMLEAAVEDGLMLVNPARKKKTVKAPTGKAIRREQKEMVTWTGEQLNRFLTWNSDVYEDDMHALWRLLSYSGIRRGEALALKWKDIDAAHSRIRVRRSVDTTQRGVTKKPKTGAARTVDMDTETINVLKTCKAQRGSISLDFARPDAYVFGLADGSVRRPDMVSEMWARRMRWMASALTVDPLPRITLHGLRHTHASILLEQHVPAKVVQERLGHSSITTTMNVYAHVTETAQRSAVDTFTAAIQ
ncbi:tyrosine-type recombinase/integrase [Pseudoclavibacter sp. VKM Ac-2867]|uniref:tyrosine-type recombinase/integrase n=1 Tax=Pseudoclavibacter sp. VKM Ac-2867 TaxID=2783829 RepID=UPI00188C57D4|nr:site-specific integrase [Pseudoclavibacter sp. VKM Ac-2867]MBF4458362.1 site-specific integrase [Pseudoclavibacter sp. VKM Ac-2867]